MTTLMQKLKTGLSALAGTAVLSVSFMAAPALLSGGGLSVPGFDDVAVAEDKKKKPKTKKAQTLSKRVHERIQESQELLGEGKHAEALSVLNEILERASRLKEYELAVTYQMIGFTYADQDDYVNTVQAFKNALELNALPDQAQVDLMYNMGQLYMALEDYEQSVATLLEWFKIAENPAPRAHILLGNGYYQLADKPGNSTAKKQDYLKKATKQAATAIKKAKGKGKESWYRFLLALYFEQEKYKHAERVLEVIVRKFPGKAVYWKQLSAVTAENKKEKRSFSIAELAYLQGFLDKSRDMERLAQLYMYHDNPYRAGKVLEKAFDDGMIEKTADNWELLAQAWMGAREHAASIAPLTEAAKLSDDGELYLQLGQAYVANEKWDQAYDALIQALKKGGLKRPGNAYLIIGMVEANLGKYDEAKKSFVKAQKHKRSKRNADRWLNYIQKLEEQGMT